VSDKWAKYPDDSPNFMQMLAQFQRNRRPAFQIDTFVESTRSGSGRISAARKIVAVQMTAFRESFLRSSHKGG